MSKKHNITVEVLPPVLPNFVKVSTRLERETIRVPVSVFSDKEASDIWDAWKSAWLEHVARKRNVSESQ